MLLYGQLDPKEQIKLKSHLQLKVFLFKEMYVKLFSAKWWPYCLGFNVLVRANPVNMLIYATT